MCDDRCDSTFSVKTGAGAAGIYRRDMMRESYCVRGTSIIAVVRIHSIAIRLLRVRMTGSGITVAFFVSFGSEKT